MKKIIMVIIAVLIGYFYNPTFVEALIPDETHDIIYHGDDLITYDELNYEKIGVAGEYTVYRLKRDKVVLYTCVLEKIYEDEFYTYSFPYPYSDEFLLINQNDVIGVKDALNEGKVSIDDLMKITTIYKDEKN